MGLGRRTSAQNAALLNGIFIHSTEMDDGQRFGAIHLGAAVVPAVLAAAENDRIDDLGILRGVIMGYEAAIRLASAMQPGHKQRGYHTSGTCGTIGAAVGVAFLLGLSKQQVKDAVSLAVTSAAGVLEAQEDGSRQKPYNLGRAAMDGMTAAYMARAGLQGPDDAIGGRRGLFEVMGRDINPSYLNYAEDDKYAIETIYIKPYAACRHCHPAIDCVMQLRDRHGLSHQNVAAVSVHTYKAAVVGHDHTNIQGMSSAMLSIPFSVALALIHGRAGLDDFNECFDKEEVLDMTRKVSVVEDADFTNLAPAKRGAAVHVTTIDGATLSCEIKDPKGEPENPISDVELRAKFISLANYAGVDEATANDIVEKIKSNFKIINHATSSV